MNVEQWRNTADRLPVAGALVEVKGHGVNTELARYLIDFSIHGMRGWVKFNHSNHLNFVPLQWRYVSTDELAQRWFNSIDKQIPESLSAPYLRLVWLDAIAKPKEAKRLKPS